MTNAFDKAGRETLSTTVTHPVDSNCSSLTEQDNKNYDAADHILAANGTSGYNYTFGWGPNGHAVTINDNRSGTSTSIHWDGAHPLFESDANGSVNAIFVGDLGAYSSQSAQKYPLVLTAIDRDFSTKGVLEHNASGYGYWTPLSTPYVSNPKFQQFAEEPTQYPSPSFTGQLLYLPYSLQRTDALDVGNGKLEIAGVRAYDPALGSWTTPDAYAGDVHDPMSQKPYMWNRNNPVAYSDPSGYDPDEIERAIEAELLTGEFAPMERAALERAAESNLIRDNFQYRLSTARVELSNRTVRAAAERSANGTERDNAGRYNHLTKFNERMQSLRNLISSESDKALSDPLQKDVHLQNAQDAQKVMDDRQRFFDRNLQQFQSPPSGTQERHTQ